MNQWTSNIKNKNRKEHIHEALVPNMKSQNFRLNKPYGSLIKPKIVKSILSDLRKRKTISLPRWFKTQRAYTTLWYANVTPVNSLGAT